MKNKIKVNGYTFRKSNSAISILPALSTLKKKEPARLITNSFLTHCILVLFHCYMLDESICHFSGVGSVLPLLPLEKYVASDLGLHCLPMTLLRTSR